MDAIDGQVDPPDCASSWISDLRFLSASAETVPPSSPGISQSAHDVPSTVTTCRWYWEVCPSASLDVPTTS